MGSVLRKAVASIRGEAYTTMISRFCSKLLGFEGRMRTQLDTTCICPGQQSGGRERAVDGRRTCEDVTGIEIRREPFGGLYVAP